jgi:hypothetical protein
MGVGRNGNCDYATDLGLASEFPAYEGPLAPQFSLLGTANFALNGHRGIRRRTWN